MPIPKGLEPTGVILADKPAGVSSFAIVARARSRTGAKTGHAGTLAVYAATMLGTSATALICRERAPAAGWWALAAWTAVVCMLFATIDYHWRKKTNVAARPSRWPST